jgi:hypothetical protein
MLRRISKFFPLIQSLPRDIQYLKESLGRIEARQTKTKTDTINDDTEFRVYSQWGEDGVIQYLINKVPINSNTFVEFGVEDYTESNTRFLLSSYPWAGLVIDGSSDNIRKIRSSTIYALTRLTAVHSFITAENINSLLCANLPDRDVDLLSIDIDGNDYWVWKAIECISPKIVIVEYNSLFGPKHPLTIPYNPGFVRSQAHYSQLYYGSSLTSLVQLGHAKGYSLVYANNAGNNAFFVRHDCCSNLSPRTISECYRKPQFRESLDRNGLRTFLEFDEAQKLISHLSVYNTESSSESSFSSFLT